jgi:predicted transposase YbfD/YdcC
MNAKYKNLYQEIVSRDMTDLDEDLFYNEYSTNDEKFANLYSYALDNNLTSLDPKTFQSEYFGVNTVEKKNPDVTELPSEDGLSERFTDQTTKDPVRDSWNRPESDEWFGFNPDTKKYTEGPNKGLTGSDVYSNSGAYILESNPEVLYKKNGQHWLKQVGGRYVPLTKGDIKAREKILNEQAVKASQFQIDWIKNNPKQVEIKYESVSDAKMEEKFPGITKITEEETKRWQEENKKKPIDTRKPTSETVELAIVGENIYDLQEEKSKKEFYKSPVTSESFIYWLDAAGKPRQGLDPVKSQQALDFAKRLIGEPELAQLSKIDKLGKINLNVPSADKFLNKEFYNSNFSFEQDGNELIINSYLPGAKYDEDFGAGDVENTISIDLSSKNSGTIIKQFLKDNLFYKVDVDRFNEAAKNPEKYIDFILSSSSKLKMTDDRKNILRDWQQQESAKIDADIKRNDLSNLDKEIKLYESAVLLFNKKVASGNKDITLGKKNLEDQAKILESKQKEYSKSVDEFNKLSQSSRMTQAEFDLGKKNLEDQAKILESKQKEYSKSVDEFNKLSQSSRMTQAEFDKENDNISNQYKKILKKQEISSGLLERITRLEEAQNLLEITYPIEAKGSILGSQLRTFVQSVVATPLKTGLDISLAAGNLMMGDEKFAKFIDGNYDVKKLRGLTDKEIANSAQAKVKELNIGLTDLALGQVTGTNKEYYQDPNNSMIFQALNAVIESVGTAQTGGGSKLLTTAAFFSLSYNAMEDQMRGPDFDHLSENEKKLISVPYGLVIGQMEKWGFDVAVGAGKNPLFNKFANYIVTKTFKNLPKNAGLIELNSAIQKNIGASIAKGLIKITGAGVSEGNVEFMQQEFEGIQKFAVNEILKNDNFNEEYFKDAPDLSKAGGWSELMDQGVDAFKLGFLAGGMTTGGSMVKNNIVDIRSNNKFDIYKSLVLNKEAREGWIASIQKEKDNGTISFEEMNKKIDEINRSYSTLIKIPASLTTQSQREAFSLLQERENIENEIKDKEPNLVVKETNRIKEINEALKTTSENATKEDNIVQQEGSISEYQGTNIVQENNPRKPGYKNTIVKKEESTTKSGVTEYKTYAVDENGNEKLMHSGGIRTTVGELAAASQNSSLFYAEDENGDLTILKLDPNTEVLIQRTSEGNDSRGNYEQRTSVRLIDGVFEHGANSSDFLTTKDIFSTPIYKTNTTTTNEKVPEVSSKTQTDSTVASKVQQEEQVATLRAEEQAELLKAIPKIESYKVNGEIDKTLMPKTVLAKYNKIYDKYDNLISPLLETTGEVAIDKPVITTNTTAEVQRVKSLTPESEDGATFNIDGTKYEGVGLVVPVDSMNTTTEELTPEMVADFVAERQEMIGDAGVVKAGIYKFPNSNQVSIDLSVVVPETSREQALEFARLAGQESLFDLETFENIKTGATGQNPMKFTSEQHREISKALKEGRIPNVFGATAETTNNLLTKENVKEFASKQKTTAHKLIVKAAKMVLNAIPGVKIYMHNNGQEMASAIEASKKQLTKEEKTGLKESSGLYVDGDIHINLESATIGTVYHEAFHALIEKNGIKSGSILLMAKGLKNIISDKGIKQRLDDFVSQYNEDEKAEEYISELGGILSEAEQELTTTKLQQFKTLINNIAKKLGLPVIFSASATAQDAADFINTMSKKLRTGENILADGFQTNIISDKIKSQIPVKVNKNQKLTFVKQSDIIDIKSLVDDIVSKNETVWFWVADQLGRGVYFDSVINGNHYLDAGPSYALDPENRSKNIIWASGANPKTLNNNIDRSDYIFIISGSPQSSKLFNKKVSGIVRSRIEDKVDFNEFKKSILNSKPTKQILNIIKKHNSYDELFNGSDRKAVLISINEQKSKNTKLNKVLESYDAFIDLNELRDGFYKENDFKLGDVMLVLKPEKIGDKSNHSTYETDIIGSVIGVPDLVINSFDLMTDEVKNKYKNNLERVQQQQIVAPYGMGVKNISKIKFQKNKTDKLTAPVAGNKLFNEPLKQALDIAKSYMKSIGKEYSPVEKITKLDEGLSKRISDAYDKMKDDPTNPEVKAAYEVMAKETLDQYDAITAKGYKLEINNNEPYSSSEDMINDLRDNNRMKIFSTESGFGEEPITDKQREENILLKDSGRKDANGETLLVNDVFRFVHDFFGHAKLGNSFGPIGEENAWRVHSEMYSPEAKKAMTSETRGQNSWVNFSGVNDAAFKKREKARQLRKEGKIDQANQMVGEVYDEMKFADQKIGLLPSFAVEEGAPSKIKFQKTRQETRMDNEAEAIFKKSLDRGVAWNTAIQNVIDYIQISKWYEEASDIDREQKIRNFRQSKKQKLKKAPSVDKILGTPKPSMVTVKEKTALKDQIKLEARAAREAKVDLNQKRKLLSTAIKGLVKLGKLTTRQAGIIIERVGYVNLDDQVMVNRLADYAARVFEKADYQERLSRAFSFKKGIRKLLKGDIQAEVVGMAKKFSKIDPSMVDDIEKYLEMAEIVKNAIKPSRINRKDGDVKMRESMNIDSVSEFTNDAIENQEAILKEELLAVHSELVDAGVIDDKMSLSDIESIINSLKEKEDGADYEGDILTFLSNRIDTMSEIIKDILTYKINPMTGEDVALTEKNIDLISRMLNIDINNVSIKETIFIAEAMDNFINNNITSSVEAVIEKHEGATELENLIADKVVASPLRKYFSNKIGQYMSEQIASMPILFEKLFVGAKNALMVAKKMGWTALINGVNKAEKMFNTTVDVYFKQYSKTKPNGKSFNDAENVYERGMLAFLSRNVSGTVTQQAEELKRRVEVLKESVKNLLEGSTKEQKMGEIYQKIYDKLNVESGDIDIISANVDKINKSAVNWWINQWGTTYNDLSDISLSVYNTMLSSDTSYSTDRYKLLDKANLEEIIEPKNIGAFGRDIEFLDKNKTGVLMESNRPSASKVSKANRYISLDFDVNNSSAYKAALIDVNTAAAIRRIDGFINSKNFNKLIPTKEDRDIFRRRISEYIQAAKNKRVGPSDTMHYLDQLTNFLGGIGVGKALGGIDQIVKQTLPIALSTFTNSGRLDILTPASNAWIDSLGMAISNRGQESQSTIESIDRRLDKANSGAKVVSNFIVDAQQMWLKWCLSKPDVFIAKSSFISYYKQYLSKNNQSTDIDWATHNVNQDAADYAMLMVDRQQNVSDAKMAGKVFNSQNSTTKIMRKLLLPFASFSLNQKSRMVSDIKVLGINSGASKQDKIIAARSLLSLPLEMVLYQSIGLAIRLGYLAIAKGIIGAVLDDDDEEKEKLLGMEISKEMKNATKYPLRSMVTDFLSPIPIADNTVVGGANYLLSQLSVDQDMIDEAVSKKNLMLEVSGKEKMNDKEKQNFIEKYKQDREYQLFNDEKKSYGTIGIGYDTYKELMGNINTAYTGKYTQDYMGNKSERFLLPKDQDNIKNAVIFEALFALGIVPRDVNTVTNNIIKLSKKNSLTETQYEKYKAVGKETGGKVTGWKMDLVKSKSKTESTLEELEWIKGYGGLTEKQGQEYIKLSKLVDEVSYMQLMDLQSGMTADKIIKSY